MKKSKSAKTTKKKATKISNSGSARKKLSETAYKEKPQTGAGRRNKKYGKDGGGGHEKQ